VLDTVYVNVFAPASSKLQLNEVASTPLTSPALELAGVSVMVIEAATVSPGSGVAVTTTLCPLPQ
jgi:hypothetical protein